MSGKPNKFFLGKVFDLDENKLQDDFVYYDPDDLTTHGVITGMTGSGKTGLGMIMLEEAALQGIPAIAIDPKGDLTNLLLHFPDLLPEDFQPWVDQDAARRDGISVEEAAQKAASSWENGLASYGIGKPELLALKDAVEYTVYTPGSDAGIPVSVMASFTAPDIPWDDNKEILRERISSTVTALLGLIGFKDIDPVRMREHILLSNIFESNWRDGKDLDMETLIFHVQTPPFEKLGVLSLEQFYPEKDRFSLAMLLNNFLAAPAFHTWLEGQPLNIAEILFTPAGKPRHSVFYLAHLSDQERMFFVTLLYSAIETWMRTQRGSGSLRALVYFDEVMGYLPPVANPPSKEIILRMLKMARAFGVGLLLATQNPVDLDYKALSNCGTWMIGKLQTDQDKARLLDGLEGAAPGINRSGFDKMISQLGKRVFLLHNVHESQPQVFGTRWAMNYLAGPLTRAQIPELNALVNAKARVQISSEEKPAVFSKEPADAALGQSVAPAIPGAIKVSYFPVNRGPAEALKNAGESLDGDLPSPKYVYRPALVGQARVAYLERKYNISQEKVITVSIDEMRRRGLVKWEDFSVNPFDLDDLMPGANPDASFEPLDNLAVVDAKTVSSLEADFTDWIYRTQTLTIRKNDTLGVVAGPEVSEDEFRKMSEAAAKDRAEKETGTIKAKHKTKIDRLEERLRTATNNLEKAKQELNHRRMEEAGKGLENVLGLAMGRQRSLSTSLTKRRMTSKAKADLDARELDVKQLEKDLLETQDEMKKELEGLEARWLDAVDLAVEEGILPYKKNIFTEFFGVIWLPYYAFKDGDAWLTVPAFEW